MSSTSLESEVPPCLTRLPHPSQDFAACTSTDAILAAAANLNLGDLSNVCIVEAALTNDTLLYDKVEYVLSYCYDPSPYSCTGPDGAPPLVSCQDAPNYDVIKR